VRAVTAEDLMRVANFYLDEKNRTVATLVPIPPKPGSRPAPPAPQGPMGPVH
jgi:predicted Zn-dependent peptidase